MPNTFSQVSSSGFHDHHLTFYHAQRPLINWWFYKECNTKKEIMNEMSYFQMPKKLLFAVQILKNV